MRRSKRLLTKEANSALTIERLKERIHNRDNEDSFSSISSSPSTNTSSSDTSELYITPVKQLRTTNNFTKGYNAYNMDKGVDGYEADFIDDDDYKSSQNKKKISYTPVRRKRKGIVIISDAEDEETTPTRCRSKRRRLRRRINSSSSSSESETKKVKRRRMQKMESDDELDITPVRERSSRAKILQYKKRILRQEQFKEFKGNCTVVEAQSSSPDSMTGLKENKGFPLQYDNSSNSEDTEEEEEEDCDWIVPDEECSLDGWEIATDTTLCSNLSQMMSFKELLKQSYNQQIHADSYQLILAVGGSGIELNELLLNSTTPTEVDIELNNYDTTLLHITIGQPWRGNHHFKESSSPTNDKNTTTCTVENNPDMIAVSLLKKLHNYNRKWFIKMLRDGLIMRPNTIETAIWYKRQKCTHYLIGICEELKLDWKSSVTNELYCTIDDHWPCNYLQLALLSYVMEEGEESAAGIINILFPYMNQDYVNDRDEQGYTAVMYAAQLGDWETLTIFLKSHYVSFDVKDYEGRSLLHMAAASGSLLCVEQLLDYGHIVNCRDNKGWPPLLYAHFSGHEDCFLLLMKTDPHQLSVLTELLQCQDPDNKRKTAKVVRELLLSLAHSESYYTLFNQFVCNNLSVLDDGTFRFMKHCMSLVSFENKQAWLKRKLQILREDESYSIEDDYYSTSRLIFHDMPRTGLLKKVLSVLSDTTSYRRGPPDVTFVNEPGICTGPRKEFWTCLSHELADGQGNIFTTCDDSQLCLQPYQIFSHCLPNSFPSSSVNDHLVKVNTIGSLLATAVMYGDTLDCTLSLPLVKQLLGQAISVDDLESTNGDLYKQLMCLKDDTVEGLDLTFSATLICPCTKQPVDIELKEGSMEEQVTDMNKCEYIDCLSLFTLLASIRHEIKELKKGFWKVIPKHYITSFTPNEFSLLLSGVPHINIQDWKENTKYSRNFSSIHHVALWFWKLVEDLSEHEKGLLLKFCTGSPRLPPGGFSTLQGLSGSTGFTLSLGQGINKIPHAQTCFNLLVLSDYSSEQELRNKGLIAIRYGCEGFAFS